MELSLRNDIGALWENFLVSERVKANHYAGNYVNAYFWRTTRQQEVDYLEECDGRLAAFEFKWNPKNAHAAVPSQFAQAYDVERFTVITPENYMQWLLAR